MYIHTYIYIYTCVCIYGGCPKWGFPKSPWLSIHGHPRLDGGKGPSIARNGGLDAQPLVQRDLRVFPERGDQRPHSQGAESNEGHGLLQSDHGILQHFVHKGSFIMQFYSGVLQDKTHTHMHNI